MRIRGFTGDDSHLYVAPEQLADEITSLLDFVLSVLRAFWLDDFTFSSIDQRPRQIRWIRRNLERSDRRSALSLRPTRNGLRSERGRRFVLWPKDDIDVKDAIGISWQLSTIQCDLIS